MPSTSAVAPLAIDMALRSGAELEILYVGMAFPPSEPGSMALPSFIDQPQYEWARWKREFLYRFGECHWGGKLPVDAQLVLATGNPGEAILEQAERHGPDLIVIGWHGELSHSHARTLRTLLAKAHWVLLVARV
jgi:nucleotide-binding universal stress UspA family protein